MNENGENVEINENDENGVSLPTSSYESASSLKNQSLSVQMH